MITIYVTQGAKHLVGAVLVGDEDLSTATVKLALGGYSSPPAYTDAVDPTDDETDPDHPTRRTVKLLIDDNTTAGTYWLWVWIADNPEIEPLSLSEQITVA